MRNLYRYKFGAAIYDEGRAQLKINGDVVRIAPRQRKLLSVLLSHPTKVIGRDELLDRVWGYNNTDIDSHALTAAIDRLRKVLGTEGDAIKTVHGSGYRFDSVPVRELVGGEDESGLSLAVGGSLLGRDQFVLTERLGGSGGIEVWRARHRETAESRVFKLAAGREDARQLKHEARSTLLVQRVLGPRADLAQMLGSRFDEAPYFLEFEYGGENLLQWSHHDDALIALDRDARIELFIDIAQAISALHSIPFVHADIKPQNILVYRDECGTWRPRVVDFGSSRALRAEMLEAIRAVDMSVVVAGDAQADPTRGTFIYMAPELWRGDSATVRTDIYSLGVLLYQIVIGDFGRRPDSGWQRGIDDPLLVEDIERAIDGDASRRFDSVAELTQRLRELKNRATAAAALAQQRLQSEHLQRIVDRAKTRRPWIVGALAVMGISILAISAMLFATYRTKQALEREYRTVQALNQFLDQEIGRAHV